MREGLHFPQNLLDRLDAAKHSPSRDPNARYVYSVSHFRAGDEDQTEECSEDSDEEPSEESPDDETAYTFDTLEKANNAALALFGRYYEDWLDQEKDMSNWYEEGTNEDQMNEVIWNINPHGELSLIANDAEEGFACDIRVVASKI